MKKLLALVVTLCVAISLSVNGDMSPYMSQYDEHNFIDEKGNIIPEAKYYEYLDQQEQIRVAQEKQRTDAIINARGQAGRLVWHNGKWVTFGPNWHNDPNYSAGKEYGKGDVPVFFTDRDRSPISSTEKALSDTKKKLWHSGAWRDAVWNFKDQSMNSYVDGNNIVTLTNAELAESDAKKRLWHNGAWHERAWENNMQGYFQDDKFITMTPAEIAASDNMLKTK